MWQSLTSAFLFTGGGSGPVSLAGLAASQLLAPGASVAVLSLSQRGGAFAQVHAWQPQAFHIPVCSHTLSAAGFWPTTAIICPAGPPAQGSHCWSLAAARASLGLPTIILMPSGGFGAAGRRWAQQRGFGSGWLGFAPSWVCGIQ